MTGTRESEQEAPYGMHIACLGAGSRGCERQEDCVHRSRIPLVGCVPDRLRNVESVRLITSETLEVWVVRLEQKL